MKILSVFTCLCFAQYFTQSTALAQTPAPTPFVDPNPYQSQTWYRLTNGLIKTLSATSGKVAYSFEQPNALPPIHAAGANFGIFKNASGYVFAAVDALGRFYQYGKVKEPAVVGGVFFTNQGTNELMVVDSDGALMETSIIAPAMKEVGGNFYFDQNGVLTTIRSMGMAKWNWAGMVTTKSGMTVSQPLFTGGNYYLDIDQKVITISSVDGFFSDPLPLPQGVTLKLAGGNYLIGSDLKLYVVTEKGDLKFSRQLAEMPVLSGYSYLVFRDQKFLFIKGDGSIFDELTYFAISGKPTVQTSIDSSKIQPASLSKIGGTK